MSRPKPLVDPFRPPITEGTSCGLPWHAWAFSAAFFPVSLFLVGFLYQVLDNLVSLF
jgi:hypothetical protein